MTDDPSPPVRPVRPVAGLHGLAVGDALGSQFFVPAHLGLLRRRALPPDPWQWTDDTEMACSVLLVLAEHGEIDQDALAAAFATHHDFDRGYGPAVNRMLRRIRQEDADWRQLSSELFDGQGSWGNGAAMRVAPLGAWFADAPERAAEQAELSAVVTHRHPEAVAGAIAVAVAAALVARDADPEARVPAAAGPAARPDHAEAGGAEAGARLLDRVLDVVPRSAVHAGLRRTKDMLDFDDVATVAAVLGCGRRTSAHDTVPFALWAAARHLGAFEEALWNTLQAGGDVDTTGAIVGGIVAVSAGGAPPEPWTRRTEVLPSWMPALV